MKQIVCVVGWSIFLGYISLQSMNEAAAQKKVMTLYCHGLKRKGADSHRLKQAGFIDKDSRSFDFDDDQGHLGQGGDIEKIKEHIDPTQDILMYGFSRGGSTGINYLAKHNPNNVKALVVDGSPHDMVDIADGYLRYVGLSVSSWCRPAVELCLRARFWGYPRNSIPPFQAIAHIKNKDLPVFIVHSQTDEVVSIKSALANYRAFKLAGFKHVYLHELPDGLHAHNASGKHKDAYLRNLHSFYKKHGLAHEPDLADSERLESLQPSLEEINARLQPYDEQQAQFASRTQKLLVTTIPVALLAVAYKKWR